MTRGDAESLVRRLLDAARHGDVDSLADCYAGDAVAVSPVFGELHGRASIAQSWRTLIATISDVSVDVSDLLVDGNRVAVLSSISAVDRIGWFGLAPTDSAIDYRLVLLLTVVDGKIVRDERIYDSAGVVQRLEKARLDKELRTAAEVQRMLMSRTTLINGYSESVGESIACRTIGGDFFDFAERNGCVTITMADVAGKGPAAALLAAMIQGMFAVDVNVAEGPATALARVNEQLLRRHLSSRFATVFRGVLSPDGRFIYSNGGHNPPLLITNSGVRRLSTGGPIVGAFEHARFEHETVQLAPADTLVLFTDGVTEARNSSGEEFGDDRLVQRAVQSAGARPSEVLQRIVAGVSEFCGGVEQADDMTVTVTRFQ